MSTRSAHPGMSASPSGYVLEQVQPGHQQRVQRAVAKPDDVAIAGVFTNEKSNILSYSVSTHVREQGPLALRLLGACCTLFLPHDQF